MDREIWFEKNGSSNLDFFQVWEKWLTRKKIRVCRTTFLEKWSQNKWPSGPFGQLGQYIKKSWGPIMSNFWGRFFMFWGSNLFKHSFGNTIPSPLKSCIMYYFSFLNFLWIFFGIKLSFRAVHILKCKWTTKRSLIAGLGIYNGFKIQFL